MKTDISGSTSRFRRAAGGLICRPFSASIATSWHATPLSTTAASSRARATAIGSEFPSVTSAAKAAIAMQEALRLAQLNRGDDRLAIRIVIALGDIAVQDGDFIGDAFALAARWEAGDAGRRNRPSRRLLASPSRPAEIQTALVENFVFKGFAERMPIYRIEQRHRTRVNRRHLHPVLRPRGFRRDA